MRLFKHLYIIGEEPLKMILESSDDKMNFNKGTGKILRAVLGPQKVEPPQEYQDRLYRLAKGIKKSSKFNQKNINQAIHNISHLFSKTQQFDIVDYLEDIVFQFITSFPSLLFPSYQSLLHYSSLFSSPFFSLFSSLFSSFFKLLSFQFLSFVLKSINISNFLGDEAMSQFHKIKNLFIELENLGLQPLSIFAPNFPFGAPAKCRKIREEIKEILRPYVVGRRERKEELDDYLSVWINSPHVGGPNEGKEYNLEEILYEVVNIMFVAHVNTRKPLKPSNTPSLSLPFPKKKSGDHSLDACFHDKATTSYGENKRRAFGVEERRKGSASVRMAEHVYQRNFEVDINS